MFRPICNHKVLATEYNTRICKCYKFAKESTCIKLPEQNHVMEFRNFKNMLERPYIVYADTECSLIPTKNINKVASHVVNSDCFYFKCTYDHTTDIMWSHVGEDVVCEMTIELSKLADECIE